ncbi:peptidoglycan editing factor PgeF [Pseudoroseicyclus tamaricis]|uniref:Purine nucleoside phosphorylase n=1 Tax=Pseudoroseicyclus tamaricis TaxID=2705421 RepID=A0A6B2K5D9_9RHOB|nr:peptidoglycan editing factor PgeF [Pseudoroseicyclus tamaricis]NDV01976.1 peptidoglycan editing factor PgeF [Pseudoroseicyclus tamaricis]
MSSLDIITSDALPVRHGFFGRAGGASSGIYAGLNCGRGSADMAEAVTLNRARAAGALGLEPEALAGVTQVHSPRVVTLEAPPEVPVEADAMVTATPGLGLAILTADCQPVLLSEPEAGVIGAAHAGWRGALAGVLENTVEAMVALGAERGRIRAVVGPTISQRAYEVGPELMEDVRADDEEAMRFFAGGEGDRYLFDLPGYGLWRLRRAGVGQAEWTGHCTYADTYADKARFYSYRRATHEGEADYGRLISAIRL